MRFLKHHHRSRRAAALTTSLVALTTVCGLPPAPSFAQDLFVTSSQTVAGGNPINGNYGRIVIGQDALNAAYPNITADITGGSSTDDIYATNTSLVTISAGTFGKESTGAISYQALGVNRGSTVNLTGGTLRSFVRVGNTFSNDGTISTFNMSGGSASDIFNNYGGVVNITGGNILGVVGNYATGTLNVAGGTMNLVGNFGYEAGAVTNFGGTAVADTLRADNGTVNVTGGSYGAVGIFGSDGVANISGGTLGSGGVNISGGNGQVNFTGNNFTVAQTSTGRYFDENQFQNFTSATYAVTGNLSDGSALNTNLTGGTTYTNDGSKATFGGAELAPDIFVQTDQTVKGFYNNVNIGIDDTFSTKSSPTVTIADGNDTVFVNTFGGSTTNITGGVIRGGLSVSDQSKVNISGGSNTGGLFIYNDGAANVTGGDISGGLYAYNNAAITLSGGTLDFIGDFQQNSTLTLKGGGFAADGTTSRYFDPNAGYDGLTGGGTNYAAGGSFHVTGTLADGNSFDQTFTAGGYTGGGAEIKVVAPVAAPDLYLTQNGDVNTFQNRVVIGRSADGNTNTSPMVNITDGADTGGVYVGNNSVLDVLGGVVHGRINVGGNADVNVSGGTIASVYQYEPGDSKITVSGGSIAYLVPANALTVTGGDITTIDTYSGARVNIFGGNITNVWGFGPNGYINILGGSVSNIIGYGQPFNLYGGNIGSGSIINLYGSPFDLFGMGFSITNGVAGTANGRNGVWWDVTGTLQGGQEINTRYFEANGNLTGPSNLTTTAAAPEPGTLALMVLPFAAALAYRRRRAL